MTLTQIKYFVTVAEHMSFTYAAAQLFVSQQVVSKQIKHMEEEIGFLLFAREKGKISLTLGGELLYRYWSKMLKEYNQAMVKAHAVMKKEERLIRIGTLDISRVFDWIADVVSAVSRENPNWHFRVDSGSYRYLFQQLLDGRFDCIISLEDENRDLPEAFEEQVFYQIRPQLVIADSSPLYHEGMSVLELEDEPLYVLSPKFSKNALINIRQYCVNLGFEPGQIEEFDEISGLEMALHAGRGYTLMYEPFFRNPVGRLRFIDLEKNIHDQKNGFTIAYPRENRVYLQPLISCFQQKFM